MGVLNDNAVFQSLLKDVENDSAAFDSSLEINDILDSIDNSKKVRKIHDWVQYTFTFVNLSLLRELFQILKYDVDEIEYNDYSRAGYQAFYELGPNIKIFICGEKNKDGDPVNLLEMTGLGCRDFEKRGGSYLELFTFMRENHGKATRIDSSHDVFTNEWFDMNKLIYYAKNKIFSPARSIKIINGYEKSGKSSGSTLYIGKYDAPMSICIYEKDKERIAKSDYAAVTTNFWLRIEVRARQNHAETYVNEYCLNAEENDEFISKYLYSVLDFKNEDSDNDNIRKRDTAKWWKEFIGFAEKQKFSYANNKTSDLKVKKNWLKTSVSRVLMCLFLADGDRFFDYIRELIVEKGNDISKTDVVMINEYLKENGYKDKLSVNDCCLKLRLLENKKY